MTEPRSTETDTPEQPGSSYAIDRLHEAFVNRRGNAAIGAAIEHALEATLRGPEARGVVVTGPSGAGKSTLLERLIMKNPRLGEEHHRPCRIMKLKVESPCTLKSLGRAVSSKAGYTIHNTGMEATTIWARARSELKAAKIRLILLDEIQNVTAPAKKGDDQLIRDTLKTLLINADWPVGLILAGQPSVVSFLEDDDQVQRRMAFTSIDPLDAKSVPCLRAAIVTYTELVGLSCEWEQIDDVIPRLIHAASHQFGWAIEILREAISIAARDKRSGRLTREHFAREYADRTGNAAFANPFLAADWDVLDPKRRNVTKPEQIVKEAPPPTRQGRGQRASK